MKKVTGRTRRIQSYMMLSLAIAAWLAMPVYADGNGRVVTRDIIVQATRAEEEAKYESQQTSVITSKEIEKKQAKSVEDVIFQETGVSRTVDAMGRVGVSIRGAEPRHTLILVDGQRVMGDLAKYYGASDEVTRLGTENVDHIEVIQGAASAKYGADAIGGVINVVTKKAKKKPTIQINAEGRRVHGEGDIFPYQNVFFRADSGEMGKLRLGLYGSKRDIMPVYAARGRSSSAMQTKVTNFEKNSLRFFGTASDTGLTGTYKLDDKNSLDFRADRYNENLDRYMKHSDSMMEPQQHFKRNMDRDTYGFTWTGNNGGKTNWSVDANYSRTREDDVTVSSYYGKSSYEGKNQLEYVDDVDHRQLSISANASTQINDKHLLSYGFGFSKEDGSGSRLKSAPHVTLKRIDPWDYDKSLFVISKESPLVSGQSGEVASNVHAYEILRDENGIPYWNNAAEWYNYDRNDPTSQKADFTYTDYKQYFPNGASLVSYDNLPAAVKAKADAFAAKILAENASKFAPYPPFYHNMLAIESYYNSQANIQGVTFNGKRFKEAFKDRNNMVYVGKASINKQYLVLQDMWQVDKDTIVTPSLRLDKSDLFGAHLTANLGLTKNVGGNVHRRFKANIGTGYTEPGMGELYYNWEMYSSSPVGSDTARLGWYFIGNPDLKPEKSLNFDIGYETENAKTNTRFNLFHNRIKDYMSIYFTGALMDFHPELTTESLWGASKFLYAPDMIYSFKNIGKAEITGLEFEVKQRFNKHWNAKLGYTWLHAINKTDPNMPRQLLDKPVHKIDVGLNYENEKSGWSGSLWADYYINMLDSNSIANNGNYMESYIAPDSQHSVINYHFAERGKQTYQKKTYGIWNLMVQKKFRNDAMMYFGIDNIFAHRDDDRALQDRVYRFGVNLKFGQHYRADGEGQTGTDAGKTEQAIAKSATAVGTDSKKAVTSESVKLSNFIQDPFDTTREKGVDFIGDYRARWNAHDGSERPAARTTFDSRVGSAEKNLRDNDEHGFEQRIRVGVDARIDDKTNVKAVASASGMTGVDTSYDMSESKGFNHARLDTLDVTRHAAKWDYSLGRLNERMGVTGYWFGKEYDGARAVRTDGKSQLRLGFGSFKNSTGISDSPYTHVVRENYMRVPTIDEFIGLISNDVGISFNGEKQVANAPDTINFYQQLERAKAAGASTEELLGIMRHMYDIAKSTYGNYLDEAVLSEAKFEIRQPDGVTVTYTDDNGDEHTKTLTYAPSMYYSGAKKFYIPYNDGSPLQGRAFFDSWWDAHKGEIESNYVEEGFAALSFEDGIEAEDVTVDMDALKEQIYRNDFVSPSSTDSLFASQGMPYVINEYFSAVAKRIQETDGGSQLPREAFKNTIGEIIPAFTGVLVKDDVPALKRAAFIQYKREITPTVGISAWYLRSFGDSYKTDRATGTVNEKHEFSTLANVFGIGAAWQIGKDVSLSFDYGQNRTKFGRFLNGHTTYEHAYASPVFNITGYQVGGTPHFWTVRFDMGKADTKVPGSWNAFADYKYFEHGSFFGGNGTEGVPDRYMDGIRSFTFGAGYVPRKDLLIEAFYTFDAKGTGKRDTLYGPENFRLGNYTRIQATYKF